MSGNKPKDLFSEIDLRLNGVIGELGQALSEAMAKLEDGGGEVRRSQSFQTSKGPVRAEAGIRVRMGGVAFAEEKTHDDPKPVNRPSTDGAPDDQGDAAQDIAATIVANNDQWSLTAELPGVAEDGLQISISDGQLVIAATGVIRAYRGTFEVPAALTREALAISLRNGILDITARLGQEGRA